MLLAAIGANLTACSRTGTTSAPSDTLTIALPINPSTLNPILEQNTPEAFVGDLLFSKLVTIDDHGNQVPDLAATVPTLANGGISKDGLTITYHLRKNAMWSDGVPVTSKDVVFTWHAIMNGKNNVSTRRGYDQYSSMSTPNASTVVMHFAHIFPPAIDTIFGESDTPYCILPEHLLSRLSELNDAPFNAAPVGSGPYKFARWIRGDSIVLTSNAAYYRGAPKIRQLVLKDMPDNSTVEAQLRTGETDLGLEITGTSYNDLRNVPGVVLQLAKAPSFEGLYFNLSHPPLDDVRVRRAITLAIDRDDLLRVDGYGSGTPAIADITKFSWAYDPSLKPVPFDPAQAKALLDAAGWRVGPDGMRSKNGQKLSLQLVYGQGSQLARNLTVQLQQILRGVGVDVQLKSYDYQTLYGAIQDGGILNGGKFDMSFYAWVTGADPDNSSNWLCSMVPPAGNNINRYCSKEMDAEQAIALSTFDRSVRKASYSKIEALLIRDVPADFFYDQSLRYAHTPALHGFSPNGISESWNANEWSLQ